MPWVNYRDVRDRFDHIDATVVRATVSISREAAQASVTVNFYPWWEHPEYCAARGAGRHRKFSTLEAGCRDVTVEAVNPCAARISRRTEVEDRAFSEQHPILWEFCPEVTVYINSPFHVAELTTRMLPLVSPWVTRDDLARYLDPTWQPVAPRGIAVPVLLHGVLIQSLAAMNVAVLRQSAPVWPELVVFLLDHDDYIVAEDFRVDLPDFRHDSAWLEPEPEAG